MSDQETVNNESIARDTEFRLAVHTLSQYLAGASMLLHKWRHEIAEHTGVTQETPFMHLELRLKHWLNYHQEQLVIHTPTQLMEVLHEFYHKHSHSDDNS